VAAVWLSLLGYGLRAQYLYAITPGTVGTTPAMFPAMSQLRRAPDRSTLFMFVHPECPCTRASLSELRALISEQPGPFARVLVVAPPVAPSDAQHDSMLASLVGDMPELAVFVDRDAAEAQRFGARTSGYVALYDAHGHLQFSGGITGSRGHVGDNVGLQTVRAALRHEAAPGQDHPVYGCPLAEDDETQESRR
jgi:hypothetical protein